MHNNVDIHPKKVHRDLGQGIRDAKIADVEALDHQAIQIHESPFQHR